MTTREIISLLLMKHKGWNADGERGVLPLLNTAHKILMASRGEQMVYLDEANGQLPYFNTTEGTMEYSFSTVREIKHILVEVGVSGSVLGTLSGNDYGILSSRTQPVEIIHFSGIDYMRIRYIRSTPATDSTNAKVVFLVDPGTTSGVYQYLGYKGITDLTSPTVQHDVPPPYDSIYLEPAADLLIAGVENGNYVNAIRQIQEEFLPKFMIDMSRGEQGFCYDTLSYGEYY